MFRVLIKYTGISGMCGCAILASTSFTNEDARESPHRVSLNSATRKVEEITKLEDIDVWGKQNGCSFIFIDDWNKKIIYTAVGFAEAKGGKKEKTTKDDSTTWEEAIVAGVNKFKHYCGDKLKTFSFQYSKKTHEFYIADPDNPPLKERDKK